MYSDILYVMFGVSIGLYKVWNPSILLRIHSNTGGAKPSRVGGGGGYTGDREQRVERYITDSSGDTTGGRIREFRAQKTGIKAEETGIRAWETEVRAKEKEIRAGETGIRAEKTGIRAGEIGIRAGETVIRAEKTGLRDGETELEMRKQGLEARKQE